MSELLPGPHTAIVPATSANIGPGYDSFGLALGLYDEVSIELTGVDILIEVAGEGADTVGAGRRHLVVSAFLRTLLQLGHDEVRGLKLKARNRIPHARGLGSSSAAIVAGVYLAHAAANVEVDRERALRIAGEIEGHPDNVAPCIYGDFTIAYSTVGGAHAVSMKPHTTVTPWVFIPAQVGFTAQARDVLPPKVPHADAAFNVARAALLVEAITRHPRLLWEATSDRLHQSYRASVMPHSWELVCRLREAGFAAAISGAGPTVLVLTHSEVEPDPALAPEFAAHQLPVGDGAWLR
ncbi:homoserine kinase [Natronoglycomyces albus]|uniref:Homoserine kinase n=1 Tax=Natronoglycomyces albus TaxID=2811108 RepID=A0A895XUF3_9ACTN|nr:homoserine kinase [Natronoglycomyces albus]QSB06156.1 homoserine kinase [Natronoglycomyces albus]